MKYRRKLETYFLSKCSAMTWLLDAVTEFWSIHALPALILSLVQLSIIGCKTVSNEARSVFVSQALFCKEVSWACLTASSTLPCCWAMRAACWAARFCSDCRTWSCNVVCCDCRLASSFWSQPGGPLTLTPPAWTFAPGTPCPTQFVPAFPAARPPTNCPPTTGGNCKLPELTDDPIPTETWLKPLFCVFRHGVRPTLFSGCDPVAVVCCCCCETFKRGSAFCIGFIPFCFKTVNEWRWIIVRCTKSRITVCYWNGWGRNNNNQNSRKITIIERTNYSHAHTHIFTEIRDGRTNWIFFITYFNLFQQKTQTMCKIIQIQNFSLWCLLRVSIVGCIIIKCK